MRWMQTEYLLKGLYLGLVLYAALQQAHTAPENSLLVLARVNLCALGGLAVGLGIAAVAKLREGYRARGRMAVFLLFLLLESPTLVYAGILLGTLAGIFLVGQSEVQNLFVTAVGGGAAVGLAFGVVRDLRRNVRGLTILGLGAVLVVGGLYWIGRLLESPEGATTSLNTTGFSIQLLLGLPFFYLLTFAGHEEESEVEIGLMGVVLGVALGILTESQLSLRPMAFILPVVLFFAYTIWVLPRLRVLKHAFRGYSFARVGRYRRALQAFRRALQLDPGNALAREGFWDVHRSLDLDQLAHDPQTQALLDLDLCLDRAGSLLLQGKPTPEKMNEALRLLDLVLRLQPARKPMGDYWRAVAHVHLHQIDLAATDLERLLDPEHYGADNAFRRQILLPAWQLALIWHEELRRRVGAPQLALPGRRMEAIAAVERHLAEQPQDQEVWGLKRLLYQDLTEAEYFAVFGDQPIDPAAPPAFDFGYVQQLGLALIDDNQRWRRGGEYLRMAAHGQPALGPTLFVQIAQAFQRAGHPEEALHAYELARRAGRAVGHRSLAEPERQAYFSTVKLLAENAVARGDLDAAIENYRLYTEYERSGVETLRVLADLYERKGDPLWALRVTDQALQYNAKDADLLERKLRYYNSVSPEELRTRLDTFGIGFDVDFCVSQAKKVLDQYGHDLEWLDLAHRLLELALVIRPESRSVRVMMARVLLRYGERDKALALLEEVRNPKPEKFASAEDEEAWYTSSQLLGDLYLEVGRPEEAVACFQDFKKSTKSGARTLFKLGQAYEQLGDPKRAVACYRQVTAYEGNPLTADAHDALSRLEE